MKKNSKKIAALALVGLVSVSAYAWLNNSEVQIGTNYIKPGQISIKFDNELNAIALAAPDSIPMTHDYAKGNLTAYTFDIVNDGDIDINYKIYADEITGTFDPKNIEIMLKDGERDFYYVGTLDQINKDNERGFGLVSKDNVPAGETHSYQLIAHVNPNVGLADYKDKSISFGLVVEAEQYIVPTSPVTTLIAYYDSSTGNIKSNPYIKKVQLMFTDETGLLDPSKYSITGLPEGYTYATSSYSLDIAYTEARNETLTDIGIYYDGELVKIQDMLGIEVPNPMSIDIVNS